MKKPHILDGYKIPGFRTCRSKFEEIKSPPGRVIFLKRHKKKAHALLADSNNAPSMTIKNKRPAIFQQVI